MLDFFRRLRKVYDNGGVIRFRFFGIDVEPNED